MSQQETAARARARATLTSDQSSFGTEATPNIRDTHPGTKHQDCEPVEGERGRWNREITD